ncbi:MAG: Rieske 2Fe-2S domain-containing protein [Gemmatimonadales bacterium]|nr:Rieske 2Fe-2S domain-containing protein [Gemmatimonadales bacterium]
MTPPERDVLDEVHELIGALESHADPRVREQVAALLERVDTVHRTALTHLMSAIHAMGGDAFVNRLTADPAVRLLLMSYDLVAVDRRIQAEEALDAVRGHLHARGIDVEITELVGGVVYVRIHGLETNGVAESAVRQDLEEALKAGLLGFQEVVPADRPGAGPGLVQLGRSRPAHRPVYREVLALHDLPPGRMRPVDVDGTSVLVANVAGELYAVGNRCGDSPLPLEFGELNTAELRCSWHGCRYDVRTGARVDGGTERLAVYPVAVRDGAIQVAVGVEAVGAG